MLGSHCRAIRYERHDWPFVADRGICSGGGAALPFPFLPLVPLGGISQRLQTYVPSLSIDRWMKRVQSCPVYYVGVRTRNSSWASMKSRDYSYLLASTCINSYLLVNHSCQVVSKYPTEGHRSWEIAAHPNRAWCWSCPRLILITTI